MIYSQLSEKYGFTVRKIQYHLDRHWKKPRDEATPAELQKRLDALVEKCENLVSDSDEATFGQKTKALGTLNSVLKTALQTAGMLKSLAPPSQISHDFTQSHEYRVLVAKINEAVVCSGCRTKLLEVIHASS